MGLHNVAFACQLVDDRDGARRYLMIAADRVPDGEIDVAARPLVLSNLLGLLGAADGDEQEIEQRFSQFLAEPCLAERKGAYANIIFGDDNPARPARDPVRLGGLLDGMARALRMHPGGDTEYWEAELLAGRARLGIAQGLDQRETVGRWKEAFEKAKEAPNSRIILYAGLAIGFEHVDHATALRDLARTHCECLRAAELCGLTPDFLGKNLFNLWSALDYKHLSEHDLPTRRLLIGPAREMASAQVPESVAAAVMVLLLAQLFSHQGAATDWARNHLSDSWAEVPEEIRRELDAT